MFTRPHAAHLRVAFFFLLTCASSTLSAEVTYRYSSVGTSEGSETSPSNSGLNSGEITSSNLPSAHALTFRSADYLFGSASPGFISAGNWSASNLQGDRLFGTFETNKSSFFYDVGTSKYFKGTGVYKGVTGNDTFEFFSFGTDNCPNDLCGYQGILVARAHFVPESRSWVLMMAGLALLGAALRRRSN